MAAPTTQFQQAAGPPLLEFRHITKRFFGVPVLRQVSFSVASGETVGLIGENGAGKSTLMNILGGNHRADEGELRLLGEPFLPRTSTDASREGIAFIHQELNLFSNLTIEENLFLTSSPRWPGLPLIRRGQMRTRAEALLLEVGLPLSPALSVGALSPGERQLVEIAKALSIDARLIILDEPTTSLTTRETQHLFELLRRLRSRGVSMIFISHVLHDVRQVCDRIVVLRDGAVVEQGKPDDLPLERMISLMVGRSISQMYPRRAMGPAPESALEVRGLSQPGMVHNINFVLHRREVLGVAGLMGAGRSELARLLFGLEKPGHGDVFIDGRRVQRHSPRNRIRQGLAFLTENRREEGLCLEAATGDNIVLSALPGFARAPGGWLSGAVLQAAAGTMRHMVGLSSSTRLEQPVKTLSGGNQQKVVLAKWLLCRPQVLILDEPTRGIDVGARYEIYQLINQLAEQGAAILMISSEIEELIGMSDRILVMQHGEIRDVLTGDEFERERILRSALQGRPSG